VSRTSAVILLSSTGEAASATAVDPRVSMQCIMMIMVPDRITLYPNRGGCWTEKNNRPSTLRNLVVFKDGLPAASGTRGAWANNHDTGRLGHRQRGQAFVGHCSPRGAFMHTHKQCGYGLLLGQWVE